jgi:hypothetical protein
MIQNLNFSISDLARQAGTSPPVRTEASFYEIESFLKENIP